MKLLVIHPFALSFSYMGDSGFTLIGLEYFKGYSGNGITIAILNFQLNISLIKRGEKYEEYLESAKPNEGVKWDKTKKTDKKFLKYIEENKINLSEKVDTPEATNETANKWEPPEGITNTKSESVKE